MRWGGWRYVCKMINAANRNRANGKNFVRRNRARVKVKLKNRRAKKGRKGWEDRHGVLRVCGRRRGGLAWGSGTAGCSWRFAVLRRKIEMVYVVGSGSPFAGSGIKNLFAARKAYAGTADMP